MIEIQNVTISYAFGDPIQAACGHFAQGEITSIIGKNGSGKSTLLRAAAGQLPYRGSLRVCGKECREYGARERARQIAYLPQMLRVPDLDVLTLAEHGRFPYHGHFRRMNRADRDQVEKALEWTGMTAYRSRNLKELSGGELQRAYLAMVIAQDTPMILLDEPTSHMDTKVQGELFDILRRLAGAGHGIVLVCHDLEQVFGCSDRICLLDGRRMISEGTPAEMAEQEDVLRDIFGLTLKKTEDRDSLFPYVRKR